MTVTERWARTFEPTSWVGLAGLPVGSPRFFHYLTWFLLAEIFLFLIGFLPALADPHISGLAVIPVGIASWGFGKRAGLLAAAANVPLVLFLDLSGHSWGAIALEAWPLFATAWFVSDLSALVVKQRSTSDELARSRALLQRTLDGTDRAIAQFDVEGRLLHANEAYLRAHGKTLTDLAGRTHEEAFGCADHQAWIRQVMTTGAPLRMTETEVRCMLRENGPTYWDWSIQPFRSDGAPAAIVTLENVTERRTMRVARAAADERVRESEARFRQVADNVDEIICLVSADLEQLIYVNPAYDRITGYPRSELVEHPTIWITRLVPQDREAVLEALSTRVLKGEPATIDVEIRLPTGHLRWGRIKAFPVKDAQGAVYRIAGIVEDTTERKLAFDAAIRETRQEREIEKLRSIAEFKTTFLNTAAHELATPLTPLQFELEALQKGWTGDFTPEQRESISILTRSIARLTVLIHDLLDAARLESGRLRLRKQPIDLVAVVTEIARSFERSADAAKVRLTIDAPTELKAQGDPTRIAQVATNLIDNAIKYTPEGGAVRVAVSADEKECTVSVTDTGRGLTPEQIARLFQPFTQVHDEGPYRGATGTGLGLYISRGVVESHGGRIWCESEGEGKGSRFAFTLPLGGAPT